jgi:Family of unknown function (DUF6152)
MSGAFGSKIPVGRHVKTRVFSVLAAAVAVIAISGVALAQHGNAGYDMTNMTVKKATVTEFEWTNPHCQIHLDIANGSGDVEHWTVEAPPPAILIDRDWTRKSLKPGDVVTAYFHAAKNGAKVAIAQKFIFGDGKGIWAYPDPQTPPAN